MPTILGHRRDLHDPHDTADAVATAATANNADAVLFRHRRPATPVPPHDTIVTTVHDRITGFGIEVKSA